MFSNLADLKCRSYLSNPDIKLSPDSIDGLFYMSVSDSERPKSTTHILISDIGTSAVRLRDLINSQIMLLNILNWNSQIWHEICVLSRFH